MVSPPIVRGGGVAAETFMVSPPTTICEAFGARLIGVLETVIAPPGVRVWPLMMYAEALSAVIVWPPSVMGERVARAPGGERGIMVPPTII